jgi:hypothetical protein
MCWARRAAETVQVFANEVGEQDSLALANASSGSRAVRANHIDRRRCFYVDIWITPNDGSDPLDLLVLRNGNLALL